MGWLADLERKYDLYKIISTSVQFKPLFNPANRIKSNKVVIMVSVVRIEGGG